MARIQPVTVNISSPPETRTYVNPASFKLTPTGDGGFVEVRERGDHLCVTDYRLAEYDMTVTFTRKKLEPMKPGYYVRRGEKTAYYRKDDAGLTDGTWLQWDGTSWATAHGLNDEHMRDKSIPQTV